MSTSTSYLQEIRAKDATWIRAEITKRDEALRTLKFDLGFGKVEALRALRVAKRERAQLLTVLHAARSTDGKKD